MYEISEFFVECAKKLREGELDLANSKLEDMVLLSAGENLAYIDDRKYAKEKGIDILKSLEGASLPSEIGRKIEKRRFTKSNLFPDFMFKVRERDENFDGGSILELKDSKSSSIASFNSTIPTKFKSLKEIDMINGGNLVSEIARIVDKPRNLNEYCSFNRRCFYLVRTKKGSPKVKVSIVDGSFFRDCPKEHLFYQIFLQVLRAHVEKKKLEIPEEKLKEVKEVLKCITEQTIITGSKIIEKASVKPRLRIMAEVHSEGNPHSSHYDIPEGSFNLILHASSVSGDLEARICKVLDCEIFPFSIKEIESIKCYCVRF